MALETGTYISDLVADNPAAGDVVSQGDDHLRLLKSTIKATFPNITGAVTATQAELNILDGVTASAAELNILDGALVTTTELNYVQGATSNLQTQIDALGVPAGGWELISAATASNSTALDFTGISSTYDEYQVVLMKVKPSTDGAILYMRTSTDGGSTFASGASDYYSWAFEHSPFNSITYYGGAVAFFNLATQGIGTATGEDGFFGDVKIFAPSAAAQCHILIRGMYRKADTGRVQIIGAGYTTTAADVDAIRFLMSTGNIASGDIRLYGRRK